MRSLCLTVFLLIAACGAFAQSAPKAARKASLGFWNVENLYDTVPSSFYDDSAYTPSGRLRWDTERYRAKLSNLARVIDEMSLDLIGLAEVESEAALRDLVETLSTDYNYIHRTSGDRRGMDLALLYKGDKFVPERVRMVGSGSSREFLYVRGLLCGNRVDVILVHLPSQYNSVEYRDRSLRSLRRLADSLERYDPASRVVVAGDFNTAPSEKIMRATFDAGGPGAPRFFSPPGDHAVRGAGSYAWKGRWRLYDNIFLSARFWAGPLQCHGGGIFVRPWMLTPGAGPRAGYPLRTFSGDVYLGGYSDHLPVFVIFDLLR